MRKLIVAGAIFLAIFGSSFAGEKLTREKFVDLYVQLSIAAEKYLADSVKLVQAQDSIFKAFGVTRKEFDRFRAKIDKEPEKWSDIWKEIVQKLTELDQKKREQATPDTSKPKDEKK